MYLVCSIAGKNMSTEISQKTEAKKRQKEKGNTYSKLTVKIHMTRNII
jgi:hypothetical protein